jgi:hypothetical protein
VLFAAEVECLERLMPGDRSRWVEVGVDQVNSPRSYRIALFTRFESWDDLDRYRKHPAHQAFLKHIAEVIEAAAVVDSEI